MEEPKRDGGAAGNRKTLSFFSVDGGPRHLEVAWSRRSVNDLSTSICLYGMEPWGLPRHLEVALFCLVWNGAVWSTSPSRGGFILPVLEPGRWQICLDGMDGRLG
ncbi:hypothetical protein V6N12_064907 [Hibiscus sabdariffa]|uniref:Uncharacterized protein n=1 Tax=Hibiscus sabdariffa TaxID=183260 RepID=A0ABR2G7P1_9ROSI